MNPELTNYKHPSTYALSNILESITGKKEWYKKILDNEIVKKWRSELQNLPEFEMALRILMASIQGSDLHLERCRYQSGEHCDDCYNKYKMQLMNEYKNDLHVDWEKYSEEYLEDLAEDNMSDYLFENDLKCPHALCDCIGPNDKLEDYIIYQHDLLSNDQKMNLKLAINEMMNNTSVDWHPGSNQRVRDIIHPSLYCYVAANQTEEFRYQWLPSNFKVEDNGKVTLQSYINNLDTHKFPNFIPLIESTLEKFINPFKEVIKKDLTNIQVIVKIASTHLDESKPTFEGGSWHIEGMPYEHIIATGIQYISVSGITDSYLEFRKPTIINEEELEYPQSNEKYTKHHYGLENHWDGQMNKYLGLIKCDEGASVIFPNTLQHHVKDFKLNDKKGERIILAFFLIDPEHRIISTHDIPPQQEFIQYAGERKVMTTEEACYYRERLMLYRKYFVDELNKKIYEREYSLCEH